MSPAFFGVLSGVILTVNGVPYALRVWQQKTKPHITSWWLWTLIGLALMLSYKSAGAGWNVIPAVFGFVSPLIVTALILWRGGGKRERLKFREWVCVALSLGSLVGWWVYRDNKEMSAYALVLAIVADLCAAIPTIEEVWTKPDSDRPGSWWIFAVGYICAIPAITDTHWSNYVLPIYMFFGPFTIATPLTWYRIKERVPLKEWI